MKAILSLSIIGVLAVELFARIPAFLSLVPGTVWLTIAFLVAIYFLEPSDSSAVRKNDQP